MKTLSISLLIAAFLVALGCGRRGGGDTAAHHAASATLSSFDLPSADAPVLSPGAVKFEKAELNQVLSVYAEISGRSIIRGGGLPDAEYSFENQAPMTAVEILQALDTILAAQDITAIYLGTRYVKVVPAAKAHMEPAPVIELEPERLPESSSYCTYIVRLENVSHREASQALAPFAKMPQAVLVIGPGGKDAPAMVPRLAGSILPTKDNSILVLRDYSSNVRRMLLFLEELEER